MSAQLTPCGAVSPALLQRVEWAGLHASAPREQHWHDGWLVRLSPGKAKRARCVNPLAPGTQALEAKLQQLKQTFDVAGLPLFVRITPFAQPAGLDAQLARRGWHALDATRVMMAASLSELAAAAAGDGALPAGLRRERLDARAYAVAVGALRGSPPAQVEAQVQRLQACPVPYSGWAWTCDGAVVACGQTAREADCVGLYDVFVAPQWRNRGVARRLCAELLGRAGAEGARLAYLQVDAGNDPAIAVYRRLGFVDAYGYHYRSPVAGAH